MVNTMLKPRHSFWPVLAIYAAFSLAWLLTGDWLLADKAGQQMSLPWDVAKDIAFALSSLGLLSWMLARYDATLLEFSTSYDGLFQSSNDAFLIFNETGTMSTPITRRALLRLPPGAPEGAHRPQGSARSL